MADEKRLNMPRLGTLKKYFLIQALRRAFLVERSVTNAHVVGKASKVQIVLKDGQKATGKVIERAADDIDLALVKLPLSNTPSVELGDFATVKVGSWVGAVGHGEGSIWTYNIGMISNIYAAGQDKPIFQTQIPLNPGNSGGPIFDRKGRVIGVVTAGIPKANSINFGIRIDLAVQKLNSFTKIRGGLLITAPKGVPIFVDNVMRGKGPRLVFPAEPKTYEVFAVIQGRLVKIHVKYPEQTLVELK